MTDTTQYLPREVIERHGIHLVSLYVNWDGRTDREIDLADYDGFYDFLRSGGELPSTSQPSVGDFLAVYEPLVERGDEILSIHLSGGISGTVRAAEQARELLIERGMDRGADGRDRLADRLCRPRLHVRRGGQRDRARRRPRRRGRRGAQAMREDLQILVMVDTLEYLRRGGRIGAARGVDRRDAEGQADPHDRGRDAARRARAHGGPRVRAARRPPRAAPRGRLRRVRRSSTSRRPPRPSAWPSAGARSTGATRS